MMKHFVWYGLIALVIMGAYIGLTFWLVQEVTQEHEASFNTQQHLQTQLSAQSIEEHFQWVLGDLDLIATSHLPQYLAGRLTHDELTTFTTNLVHEVYPDEEVLITYFDRDGRTTEIYTAPLSRHVPAVSLLDEWVAAYGDALTRSGDMVVPPFAATSDYQLYGVLLPVFLDGEITGVLGIVLNFAPVLEQYVIPMRSGDYGAAWVQDATSYVIYDHEPETIGRSVTDIAQPYPDLQRVNDRLMIYDSGRDEYHFTVEIGGEVDRKLVAWSTAQVGTQRLTIAMSAPDDEITGELASFRQQARLLGTLLGITLIISSGLFYLTRQRVLRRLVWHRTKELREVNTRLAQLVTERTTALAEKHSEVDVILAAMDDGVFFRRNGALIYHNPATTRLFGFSAEEFAADPQGVHAHIARAIPAEQLQQIDQNFLKALDRNIIRREDVLLTRKDNSTFYASIYMARVNNATGKLVGTVEIIHDISQEIALQEQKNRFITNASHELRHPLANLKTRLYLLRHQPEQLDDHLAVLDSATNEMARLVQDLVEVADFTRDAIKLRRTPTSLSTALDDALRAQTALAAQMQVTVHTTLAPDPLLLHGDHQRLIQAFTHLITHAIHVTPAGGTVEVTTTPVTENSDQPEIRGVVVQIQDSG
ncbi:MAG: PAS domain S-box protein, partial [Anaerolineae bacterium]|nr:PAS domain S-box protein [Anaerolineae bacterium]